MDSSPPIDFADLRNPYDFANPITDPNAFTGRNSQLREIRYYLDQATKTEQPISLALLGERASGKTSLLNMIESAAHSRGFPVGRIDLNEADVESELTFFFKVFDSALHAVMRHAIEGTSDWFPFEGLRGKTYETYLDLISTYDVPRDATWCPFRFPTVYAKAMSKGNVQIRIPDSILRADLVRLAAEVPHPIALLFDECNVLSTKRSLLEMFRNMFMNLSGFFLGFTGTPDLFPVMDDVFSPIVRQFKRIRVEPFDERDDTQRCVEGALKRIGIGDSNALLDRTTLRDLHELTAGRPYEIQLLCHLMFRRIQMGQSRRMELSVSVLDDVLNELSIAQDRAARRVVMRVRALDRRRLEALLVLCACRPLVTFNDLWAVEKVCRDNERWTREDLEAQLQELVTSGILVNDQSGLSFAGDYFDRVYTKYLAKQRDVALSFPEFPVDVYLEFELRRVLKNTGWVSPIGGPVRITAEGNPGQLEGRFLGFLMNVQEEGAQGEWGFMSEHQIEDLYFRMIEARARGLRKVTVGECRAEFPFGRVVFGLVQVPTAADAQRGSCDRVCEDLKIRARAEGGEVAIETREVRVLDRELFDVIMERLGPGKPQETFARKHAGRMAAAYVEDGDRELAELYATRAARMEFGEAAVHWNNVGYVLMLTGHEDASRCCLERSIKNNDPLGLFNLAALEARAGNTAAALDLLARAREALEGVGGDMELSRLLVARRVGESVVWKEEVEPRLAEAIRCTVAALCEV